MAIVERVQAFCETYGLRVPILQAPMSGACPPALAAAVANVGGMGASGVLLDGPERIAAWTEQFRATSPQGVLQLNIWVPDLPVEDPDRVDAARRFLKRRFGDPGSPSEAGPGFAAQCEAMLAARPAVISSIMGLFDATYVRRIHDHGAAWFACATTLDEALAAQDAGADAIVAQGIEAGGHRGTFQPEDAERINVGLFALVPRLVDGLRVPVIATGGIADGRGVAAALALGASAVQIGTALLRAPETGIPREWSADLHELAPEATVTTRAYSGRLGRAAPTPYLRAWTDPDAPHPAPYPQQRQLVTQLRRQHPKGLEAVNHWAGQNAAYATEESAGQIVTRMWRDAMSLLGAG